MEAVLEQRPGMTPNTEPTQTVPASTLRAPHIFNSLNPYTNCAEYIFTFSVTNGEIEAERLSHLQVMQFFEWQSQNRGPGQGAPGLCPSPPGYAASHWPKRRNVHSEPTRIRESGCQSLSAARLGEYIRETGRKVPGLIKCRDAESVSHQIGQRSAWGWSEGGV